MARAAVNQRLSTHRRPRLVQVNSVLRGVIVAAWTPTDAGSMGIARLMLGALVFLGSLHYIAQGWVHAYWIAPTIHFQYYGFGWLTLEQPWMVYSLVGTVCISALLFAAGIRYRLARWVLFVSYTTWFLLDQTYYLNHWYAACLFLALFCLTPADNAWAVGRPAPAPVRRIHVWLMRFQLCVIYAYAGVAKLNAEWLSGASARALLAQGRLSPSLPGLDEPSILTAVTFGGVLIDLLAAPTLLYAPTRRYAFAVVVLFHLLNDRLFSIGIFPWMMIALTTLFFAPDWPGQSTRDQVPAAENTPAARAAAPLASMRTRRAVLLSVASVYALVQVLVPLRHIVIPGDAQVTNEGHRFSWRMMLRDMSATARFMTVVDGDTTRIDYPPGLTSRQAQTMARYPDMVLQYAHALADARRGRSGAPAAVYARVSVSINGEAPVLISDTLANLATAPTTLGHHRWVRVTNALDTPCSNTTLTDRSGCERADTCEP